MVSVRLAFAFMLVRGAALSQQYVISTVAGGAPIPTPSIAANAEIGDSKSVTSVAVGPTGDIYFSGYGHAVYKIDSRGMLTRVAGNGRLGFSGDGGSATTAQLDTPYIFGRDNDGNLYVRDTYNNRIRRIDPTGIITTVAWTFDGSEVFAGNGGLSALSSSGWGTAPTVDTTTGAIYIYEGNKYRIRRISKSGVITTVAGNGTQGYSGDGDLATAAQLTGPIVGMAIDVGGNLYFGDNHRIRRVAANGIITTVAGTGTQGYSGDGGPATTAQLTGPGSLAVDLTGNVYFGDSNRVRRITTNGIVTTVAGTGGYCDLGDGGPATAAGLIGINGLAADVMSNVYIAEYNRIRKVATNGIITTVAGNGGCCYSGDGGPATNAQLNLLEGATADRSGNVYIADTFNNRIRKVATNGIITTVAGNGTPGFSGDGGPATSASLHRASGVAADEFGNLYIADADKHRVRKVAANGVITTIAGNGTPGDSGDGSQAINAQLQSPSKIAVDAAGNLFIRVGHRIRKIATNGIITTIAGNGNPGYSGDGGPALNAQLNFVGHFAVDVEGNLYLPDFFNNRIRKVATNGIITTVAGNGNPGYSGDGGPATNAQITEPRGVALDAAGNLYIAEFRRIRKVSANGIITTIGGSGAYGYSGDGGPALDAKFRDVVSISVDAIGSIYLAERLNNAIRVLKPIAPLLAVSASANAASNLTGSVAPGEIVVVYGSGIGPAQLAVARVDAQGRYGTTLAGTRVLFNGTPARMLYSWVTQASAIVPYNLSGTSASIQIEYQGAKSDPISVSVAPSAPGLFTLDATGKGQAAAFNEDGSLNTASRPAKGGTFVSLYATGEGQTSPGGVDGQPATPPFPKPLLPVQVTIDGKPAEVTYAGGAPGIVAGLMQINARIPTNAQIGNVPVVITVASASSQAGVTIAVAGN